MQPNVPALVLQQDASKGKGAALFDSLHHWELAAHVLAPLCHYKQRQNSTVQRASPAALPCRHGIAQPPPEGLRARPWHRTQSTHIRPTHLPDLLQHLVHALHWLKLAGVGRRHHDHHPCQGQLGSRAGMLEELGEVAAALMCLLASPLLRALQPAVCLAAAHRAMAA